MTPSSGKLRKPLTLNSKLRLCGKRGKDACSLHLILAAVWACLAADKLLVRKSLAFTAAPLVGLIPPFYFKDEHTPSDFLFCCVATAAGTQALAMFSLDVVRSAGFRVVRTNASAPATQAEVVPAHPLD